MELTPEKPLFHCKVKYIGSAEPTRKVQGIEAVQEPLRSVYGCVDNDIDKSVRAMGTGRQTDEVQVDPDLRAPDLSLKDSKCQKTALTIPFP